MEKNSKQYWERKCPNCGAIARSVQELSICQNCSLRYRASRDGKAYPNSYKISKNIEVLGSVTSPATAEGVDREWYIDSLTEKGVEVCLIGNNDGPYIQSFGNYLKIVSHCEEIQRTVSSFVLNPESLEFSKHITEYEFRRIVFNQREDNGKYVAIVHIELPEGIGQSPELECLGNGFWEIHLEMHNMEITGI